MHVDENGEVWLTQAEKYHYRPDKKCPECGVVGNVVRWNDASTFGNNGPDAEVWSPLFQCNNLQHCNRANILGFGGRYY